MKKILACLLALSACFLTVRAAADMNAQATVTGDTVTLTVSLTALSGARGVESSIGYDPAVLAPASAAVNVEGWVGTVAAGRLLLYSDDQEHALGNDSVLTLTFTVLSAAENERTVTVTLEETEDDLGRTAAASCVVVIPGTLLKGDLNGDRQVSSDDLTLLARHVARIEDLSGTALLNADVDDSGTVDSADLTKMARYVAKIISSWDQP